ncbi:hypothetical protein GII36_02650 [Candidatus Mycosynbacter amalyticus]|uniref:Serine protease n=1 Tax=Candidatus Mycosynbacter amalyticus TaxID=2665156 RepID=A0A857MJJ1_9BACT|nr:S1 family peptidase [Candidatus Mycosynbacter amalyticus]QHN42744.1 hypothetical protein GII36_02650 [Candidatus Mycosynbacter amalyticus]
MIPIVSARSIRAWLVGLIGAAILVGLIGAISHGAGEASAAPAPVIGVGVKVIPQGGGGCNVATVSGRTFDFAGHCGKVNDRITDANGQYVGTVIRSTTYPDGSGVSANYADIATVQMAPNVIVRDEVPVKGVGQPRHGSTVCKHGHGIANKVRQCGTVVAITKFGIVIKGMAVTPFDSGSPVIDANDEVVGIISGSPSLIDAALSAARALGIPVPDGASVATRADYELVG